MKRIIIIWIGLFSLLTVKAEDKYSSLASLSAKEQRHLADSIMERVRFFTPFYENIIENYEAELYIKSNVKVPKKNQLIRFLPTMFRLKKGINEYLTESYNELRYSAPDIYDRKVKAIVGTAPEFWEMDGRLLEYFQVNIYSPSLLHNKLISPLSMEAKKYYRFRIDSIYGKSPNRQYRIRFVPRNRSYQLVGGYFVVSEHVWSIREFCFFGRSEMIRFHNLVKMGAVGESDEFLPVRYDMESTFEYLGNKIEGTYVALLDYKSISQMQVKRPKREKKKSKYDLTESYMLRSDTNALLRDVLSFDSLRPLPLTTHENRLYAKYQEKRDSSMKLSPAKAKQKVFWGSVGDVLVSRYTVNFNEMGSLRGSPLLNPFLLSYSRSHGISYRQDFRYTRFFSGDRLLRISPRLGYNFTQKELYWRLRTEWYYWPKQNASLRIEFGNGNRIYSSDVLDELKALPDSIFDFSKIHLDYFKDLYLKAEHRWEIANGLIVDLGISMHRRTEVERSDFTLLKPVVTPEMVHKFRHTYSSFAPNIRISYTPGQYFYMHGNRKENLHSKYPTISVDLERGIKGVMGSTGSYERIELDLQHAMKLSTLRNLYYRIGWGTFTKQEELYFVDFANLRRSNLPVGWNDEIGGVFQLLDRRWYNSSRKYLRAHLTYESPFIILPHMRFTQHVLNERLYLNLLRVPHLEPYVEVGYGVGTHIFDFGVFASFANGKYQEVGCKFTFELFNR